MIVYEEYDFKVPEFLLTGIINGDTSGCTEEDEITCINTIQKFNKLTPACANWVLSIPTEGQESYFCANPDFIKLACNVFDLTLTILI